MKVGKDVVIYPGAKFIQSEHLELGDAVIIDDFVFIQAGRRTRIGSFVHIASFTSIGGGGEVVMGDFSGLSSGVRIFSGNEDSSGGGLTNPTVPEPWRAPVRGFVDIGRHALIGANTVIMPNVKIGEGAVVGACSFVNCNLDPWTVYAGCPARPLKLRPSEKILETEASLRRNLYDANGRYIPKGNR